MLDRFRDEISRLGASGALTPPPSAPASEASGSDEADDWDAGEEWEEEAGDWDAGEGEGPWAGEGARPAQPMTIAEYTTGAAVAAAMAGADPFSAADAAVEATINLSVGRAASPLLGGPSPPSPELDAEADAAARMEAMTRRAEEAEAEAEAARQRLHRALERFGIAPRSTPQGLDARVAAAKEAAMQAAREAAMQSGNKTRVRKPRGFHTTTSADQIDDDGDNGDAAATGRAAAQPMFEHTGGGAAAVAAAAAAKAHARTGSAKLPPPALGTASATQTSESAASEARRVRPGGVMLPPEDIEHREHVDRRELAEDQFFGEEEDIAPHGLKRDKSWSRMC